MRSSTEIIDRLRSAGLRVTSARRAVLYVLASRRRPASVTELVEKIQSKRINQATVYRTIESMEAVGLVRRVELGNRHAVYELLSVGKDHHHHLICEDCDRVLHVELTGESRVIRSLERRYRFQANRHVMEFFGLCDRCK